MTAHTCAACNATATPESPLKSCSACKKVSYCNQACQKAHWKTHKPVCVAPAKKNTKIENAIIFDASSGSKDANGSIVFNGATYPAGTYIDYFVPPTPEDPDGYYDMFTLESGATIWLANLPEEERVVFEERMIAGVKSGASMSDVFANVVANSSDMVAVNKIKEPIDPAANDQALHTLAARYKAA
jgi:hypothetical protein